jgi:hypothetical protein
LDSAPWPSGSLVLRTAADEALVMPPVADLLLADPHAIIVAEGGFSGVWLAADEALAFLERACEWELPPERPAFAQGAVAGLPAKLWLEAERVLVLVPSPYMYDFEERLR